MDKPNDKPNEKANQPLTVEDFDIAELERRLELAAANAACLCLQYAG